MRGPNLQGVLVLRHTMRCETAQQTAQLRKQHLGRLAFSKLCMHVACILQMRKKEKKSYAAGRDSREAHG